MRNKILVFIIFGLLLALSVMFTQRKDNKVILEYHTVGKAEVGDILVLEAIDDDGTIHIVPEDQSNENIVRHPQFIWNADEEGVPGVDGLIKVEQVDDNKYYLVPVND